MTQVGETRTEPREEPRGFFARLTPASIVGFAIMASIPVKLLADRLFDPDLWWHLATGELIVRNRAIPSVDPFSYTAPGEPWVVQEWGSEVLFHGLREWFGLYGIWAYRAIALFAVYALFARLMHRRMGPGLGTWALIGLAIYAGIPNWTERPNLMSFFLFVVTLTLLELRDARLWWFVPLAVLWANLHGMVVLGIGLLVVVAVAEWLKVLTRWEGADAVWAKRVSLVAGAGFLATFLNPEGPGLIVHVFRLVGVASTIVSEWRSPNFHHPGAWFIMALLFITIAAFALSKRRPDPTDVALMLAFTFMLLQAVRNLAVGGIVLGFVAARYVPSALDQLPKRRKKGKDVGGSMSSILNMAGLAAAVLGLLAVLIPGVPTSDEPEEIIVGYPIEAIDALNEPGVRVFAYDVWSGMVIDRAWPNAKVFIDLRWDFYGLELSEAYGEVVDGTSDWHRHLDEHCTTHVLIDPALPITRILSLHPAWLQVRKDDLSVTFRRRTEAPGCSEYPIPT